MKNLEKRLEAIDEPQIKDNLIEELSRERINPHEKWREMPYLKEDLVLRIAEYFDKQNAPFSDNFANNLYSSVMNKQPLKGVYYGICSTNYMPSEIFTQLSDWEKIYFLAGYWVTRDIVNLKERSSKEIVTTLLKEGVDYLYRKHYSSKAKGKYKRDIELPESVEINKMYWRMRDRQTKLVKEKKEQIVLKTEKKDPEFEQLSLF